MIIIYYRQSGHKQNLKDLFKSSKISYSYYLYFVSPTIFAIRFYSLPFGSKPLSTDKLSSVVKLYNFDSSIKR